MPNPPVVASYLPEFLKLDMMHVYRQLKALDEVVCHVLTHKRENERTFPYPEKRLHLLSKPRTRWLRRLIHRHVLKRPWQLYRGELHQWILDLTRLDVQLLHIYFGHIAMQFRDLMKVWPHPVVVSFHGADAGVHADQEAHRFAMREVFQFAAAILCRSESLKEDLVKLGCPLEKIAVWRTGLPLKVWPFKPRAAPENEAWRLLQVCRFVEKKGLDLTLRAFAEVRRRYPNCTLRLVGDGPLLPQLKTLVNQLGLADAVTFPGFLSQGKVKAEVYDAHLFLHPSRLTSDGNREGIPNAAIEAMASGIPVIGTLHGGFPEAIVSGESGLLVPEEDVAALTSAALQVLDDESMRQRLSEGGRRQVEQLFDRDQQVRWLQGVYRTLISTGRLPTDDTSQG